MNEKSNRYYRKTIITLILVICILASAATFYSMPVISESPSTTLDSQKLGYVLYVTGVQPHALGSKTAEQRATDDFTPELRSFIESRSYEPAFFCYRSSGGYAGPDASYTHQDTLQDIGVSANALDEQIRGLISIWQEERGDGSVPEIVIAAHSLGGTITAYWASYADADLLSTVRTVFTFDSPLVPEIKTINDVVVLLIGGEVALDIIFSADAKNMMEYGTSRLDFVSFGNIQDMMVAEEYSHTDYCWQSVTVDCCPPATDPRYRVCHFCVFDTIEARNTVAAALDATPPLYSNQEIRPLPYVPTDSSHTLWVLPVSIFVGSLLVLIYVVLFLRARGHLRR